VGGDTRMMGSSHAISGAAAWVAITSTSVPAFGWMPLDGIGVITGALVCAGAALLPDADHPNATIAHSMPGGQVLTGALGAASGGHRKGMHSLLVAVLVAIGAFLLSFLTVTPSGWPHGIQFGSAIAVCACVCFAAKSLRLVRSWTQAWMTGAALAVGLVWFLPDSTWWLPVCIGTGLWPWMPSRPKPNGRWWFPRAGSWALPVLGNAGSWREWLLCIPLTLYVVWGLIGGGVAAADQVDSLMGAFSTWVAPPS